ncbi:MAG: hypothetical protein AB1646_01810 [Thermodesulfobacteriota bacterium]
MGMFRDLESVEIDLVKEMAEGLGSAGVRLEEILEQIECRRGKLDELTGKWDAEGPGKHPRLVTQLNESIHIYNSLIDKARDALRWLLIQREACGFRRHKDVDLFYPIPPKIRPLDQ